MMKPGGKFMLLNRVNRAIPVLGGWYDDGKRVEDALESAGFKMLSSESLDNNPIYEPGSVWSVWERI
jgi:hypothetical protein